MNKSFENLSVSAFQDALIFLDIDGTLVADNEDRPSDEVLKKVKSLSRQNVVWLCSNSFNGKRNETVKKLTGLPLVTGHRKPSKKILGLIPKKHYTLVDGSARPIIVIGDKILTDGFFARRIGAKFVKVKRKLGNDRLRVKLYNLLDDTISALLKKIF